MKGSFFLLYFFILFGHDSVSARCCSIKAKLNWVPTHVGNRPGTFDYFLDIYCTNGAYHYIDKCCTEGKCNIFCCGCDKPCFDEELRMLQPGQPQQDINTTALELFTKMDNNGDKFLDLEELSKFVKGNLTSDERSSTKMHPDWFREMDLNGDGKISGNEFDADLDF